jgi:hypothetical protein
MKYLIWIILIPFIISSLLWARQNVWFPFDEKSILVEGKSLAEDYVPGKSIRGDVFIRNQDNQPEYFIDVEKRKLTVVNDYKFLDFGVLLTWQKPTTQSDSSLNDKINENLKFGDEYIEFSDVWGRHWQVPTGK